MQQGRYRVNAIESQSLYDTLLSSQKARKRRIFPCSSSWKFSRIRNVQLGYTLSPKTARGLRVTSLRLYATATEPYVHYKYDYFDPESGYAGGSPVYKTLLIGADVVF